jgi:hypothetical protein
MSAQRLRITEYNGPRDYEYVLEALKVNGKRKRPFFKARPRLTPNFGATVK